MVETELTARLGQRVQRLRSAQALTLDELARRSGVSRAMISKVERNEKNPTVGVVARLAKGLGVSLFELLGEGTARQAVVVIPKAKRMVVRDPETGIERQLLSPTFEGRGVELMAHLIPEGRGTGPLPPAQPGVEKYLVVEAGRLRVTLGQAEHALEPGDALFFEGDVPHRFDNAGRGTCRYTMVVVKARAP